MTKTTRILATMILGLAVTGTAFADPERRREERREERHEERREERHEERHEGPRGAPPAARFERHEVRRGQVWVGGSYQWRGGAYVWEPGRYEAERRGYRWREPRWEVRDGVYIRTEGGWIVDGPGMAPPALREERWEARRGFVFIRGRWDWVGGQYSWVPGHYEKERVGHVWHEPRWEARDGVYVRVEGNWE
ncbi:MAG: hypothetical protein QM831_13945 [Kofleriaceae bacterium]